MVNINTIENNKKNIIRHLKPYEMKAYLKYHINNLYEATIKHDEGKALASKRLIEEATELYEKEGYSNSLAMEISLRLAKANDVLIETLEDKHKQEVELSKVILGNKLGCCYSDLYNSNVTLKKLVECYSKEPSEVLLATIKDIVEEMDFTISEHDYLFKYHNEEEAEKLASVFPNIYDFIEDERVIYSDLVEKINSF